MCIIMFYMWLTSLPIMSVYALVCIVYVNMTFCSRNVISVAFLPLSLTLSLPPSLHLSLSLSLLHFISPSPLSLPLSASEYFSQRSSSNSSFPHGWTSATHSSGSHILPRVSPPPLPPLPPSLPLSFLASPPPSLPPSFLLSPSPSLSPLSLPLSLPT